MRKQWRCFHCDEVFTNPTCAAVHFGLGDGLPACKLAAHTLHLIRYVRELEDRLARYQAEDSDVMRSIYTLEADHRQALIRAEEDGYNRGVRDMLSQTEQTALIANRTQRQSSANSGAANG